MSVLDLDMSALPMILDFMRHGIRIDVGYFHNLTEEFTTEMTRINDNIDDIAGTHINPKSPKQVAQMLYDLRVYPKPSISTDADHLDKYLAKHPVVTKIKKYRSYRDLVDKFTSQLPKYVDSGNRIHTTYKTTRVVSGRLATENPNLMGIPVRSEDGRKIRCGFIPEDGWSLVPIDYSQIEMRLAAHLSGDTAMVDVFKQGGDIHSETCMRMFNEVTKAKRHAAKGTGFGILYGISAKGLHGLFISDGITEFSESDCQDFIDRWYLSYPGVTDYIHETEGWIRRHGYVEDMWGRRRLVPEINSVHEEIRAAGLRQGVNHTIQAAAAGIIKTAMRELHSTPEDKAKPLLQVHDELLWEINNDYLFDYIEQIKGIMENCVELTVPVLCDVEIGCPSWGQLEEVEL